MADNKIMDDLKKQIAAELQKQRDERVAIKKAQGDLRDLRKQKSNVALERAKNEEAIRDLKIELAEDREIAKDKDSPDSIRESAKERIQEHNVAIRGRRRDISKQDAAIANLNTKVQSTLGAKEFSESTLSTSRKEERETSSRMKMVEAVDSLSPKELRGSLSKSIAPDSSLEALKSGDSIRRMGGTRAEAQQAQQASAEFSSLFVTIKETRKALAGLAEGSEEYKLKQEELTAVEGKAVETLTKLTKIERDVEKRKLASGDGYGGPSQGQKIGGYISKAAEFGGSMLGSLGTLANERYVMEEQKKQAQLSLRNQSLSDLRNSATDATSYLSTGGGALFGAETPFSKNGNITKRINDLGEDYGNTNRAIPQYAVGMKALAGLGQAGANIAGDIGQATAINPITGAPISATGSAIKNLGQWGMNTGIDMMTTPSVAAAMKLDKGASFVSDMNDTVIGGATTLAQGVAGDMIDRGGGSSEKMMSGIGKVGKGFNGIANGMPNIIQRGVEAVGQQQSLIETQQSADQVARVRERLSMAYAPAMQQYMDVQPTMRSTMRSSNMDRKGREEYEKSLEKFSVDQDLGDRGFGVNEILGNTASAAQRLGRFGQGGMNEKVAKSGMMAESMGLGSAQQNIQAMSNMKAGGIDDPEALFTKAVKEGLQRGLSDSQSFQELLASAAATADGVGDFPGALKGIMTFAGSGRANDVATASAAAKTAEERMSGKTGTWRDMVKFDVTNKAAQGAVTAAKKQGIELTREDTTSLQNLANVDVKQFDNEEYLNSILTSGAQKAIKATGKSVKEYGAGIANNLRVQGTMGDSINATQSPELAQLRNDLAAGNYEAVKNKYKDNPGRLKDLVALAGSGMTANGDSKDVAGGQQMMINQLNQAGLDTAGMGMQRAYESKDLKTAIDESNAAMVGGDQTARSSARNSQTNMSTANQVVRNKNGSNLFAQDQSQNPDRYANQSQEMRQNVGEMRTVAPEKRVERIDEAVADIVKGLQEIKESFKNFSPEDMVINATKDIVIQGASAIKGVMLDNGLTQAASEAGKVIADTVKGVFSSSTPAPAGGGKSAGPSKSVPTP